MRALFLFVFLSPLIAFANPQLIVLDVNEGQSILLKHNTQGLLIDTGHAGESLNVLSKLKKYGVQHLSAIIFTHLHPDHASGYFRIKEAFPAATIYSNCHPLPSNITPDMTRWVYDALKKDQNHHCIKAGDKIDFNMINLNILWPNNFSNHNLNRHSLVIDLKISDKNILIMGDSDAKVEAELLLTKKLKSNYDALVAGHHGAKDATSESFIKQIKPLLTAISVNKNNIRGYPAQSVIKRLTTYRSIVRRTDVHRDIDLLEQLSLVDNR